VRCLGLEGTAHTFGAGVVDSSGKVLSNVLDMFRDPANLGIHPREAANHHAQVAPAVVQRALDDAKLRAHDLDLVAFSQGPGLGPCLRTTATAARALATTLGVPVVGVNHCVAHVEVGRVQTPARDPVLLYVSGGNTQVIAFTEGRYRVFGETLDVGIGNLLDKFAREQGIGFPGGPVIEQLAAKGRRYLELPYSVKGMDVAFSGLLTVATQLAAKEPIEDVCLSLQETAFAMVVEVTERAMAHTGKDEVLLGGGVACNERLRTMVQQMAEDRGARAYWPEKKLCVDNGAMIAWTGLLAHEQGHVRQSLKETRIDQRQRTDDVEVTWRPARAEYRGGDAPKAEGDGFVARGAEALVERADYLGLDAVRKQRLPKRWRRAELDAALRASRTRHEARLLAEAKRAGAHAPYVLDVDAPTATLTMERLPGERLREALERATPDERTRLLQKVGRLVARLHAGDIIHGDLTTSNLLVQDGDVAVIDFGLGDTSTEAEARGVDLHVLAEALGATHAGHGDLFSIVWGAYADANPRAHEVAHVLDAIRKRGRYLGG
jgi:bifunctional N6-L-threonylcarbamoyladenine synthase / protein kinase Bud32